MQRLILHSDLNNFYASVECLYNPELRAFPVAVVGDPAARHGIVLAKNQIAKLAGVKTGEAIWQARRKCPNIKLVSPNYERYMRFSQLAREIYYSYTPQVESFGMDECWMDLTGAVPNLESAKKAADEIRARIAHELGVTASVGVSFNKIFAKLGSDIKKPDATTVIPPESFKQIVWPLPVQELLYVGRATQAKFNFFGLKTIGDLANSDKEWLQKMLGKNGLTLYAFANGQDTSKVAYEHERPEIKSIGNSTTTPRDLITLDDVKITLYILCESVAMRLRDHGMQSNSIQISIRSNDLSWYERQQKLKKPTHLAKDIFAAAFALYMRNSSDKPLRSLGVRASSLIRVAHEQIDFFDSEKNIKAESLERAIDGLRGRFGNNCISRGILLTDRALSAVNPKEDHFNLLNPL